MTRRGRRGVGLVWVVALASALVGLAAGAAGAHPHVFIDYAVTLVVSAGDRVAGVRLTWTFDDLFSGFILQEFDKDRNGALSPAEVQRIEATHLAEFHKAGYYTTVSVNGKPVTSPAAREFRATAAKGIVTYEFTLPVGVPLTSTTAMEVVGRRSGLLHRLHAGQRHPSGPDLWHPHRGVPGGAGRHRGDARRRAMRDPTPVTGRHAARLAVGVVLVLIVATQPGAQPAGARSARLDRRVSARSAASRVKASPSGFAGCSRRVNAAQRQLNQALSRELRRLRGGEATSAALGVAWIAFLYGVLHAVGPGHGKLVVSSLFLARDARLRTAVGISWLVSLLQTVSAIAIVSVVALALGRGGFAVLRDSRRIELVCYGLIALIGLGMLAGALREAWVHRREARAAHGRPGRGPGGRLRRARARHRAHAMRQRDHHPAVRPRPGALSGGHRGVPRDGGRHGSDGVARGPGGRRGAPRVRCGCSGRRPPRRTG